VFTAGHRSTPAEVETAYINDPKIKALIDAHELPPTVNDGAALVRESAALKGKLQQDHTNLLRWHANNGARGPMPVNEAELHRRSEGLLRAQQLSRRFSEAQKANTVILDAPAAGTTEWHVHNYGDGATPSLESILSGN
jgi:hypothetical protein